MNKTRPSVPPTSKAICSYYYGKTPHDGNELWKCRCGKFRKQNLKKGYQNLISHVKSNHPEYLNIFHEEQGNSQLEIPVTSQTMLKYLIDEKSTNIFKWLEWIVMDEHELGFCEKKMTIKNTSLAPISTKTLKKCMFNLVRAVEKKISTIVNNAVNFALVFDVCTEKSNHNIGIFSTSPGKNPESEPNIFLLAFSPELNETNMNATNHTAFIRSTLELYNLNEDNLICLIGDHCSTNKSVANLMSVPLLGCRSHRLNLAIEAFIKENLNIESEMVGKLMSKLSTIKDSGRHRSFTPLRPVKRIARWLGVLNMFDRLERLLPSLKDPIPEVVQFIPNEVQINSIRHHKITLIDFKSITLQLQNQKTTISDSHVLFQAMIVEFPNFDFNKYLGVETQFIHSPSFETAIIKIQSGDVKPMSTNEKDSVKKLEKETPKKTSLKDEELSFAERVLKRRKLNNNTASKYINTKFLLPTSCDVKRLFSMNKRFHSTKRLSLLTLEALIFLKCNRKLWDMALVGKIVNENNEDEGDEDDDSDSEEEE